MMDWRHSSETPAEALCTAVIALAGSALDDLEPLLLGGVFVWHDGAWLDERTGRPVKHDDFWWCAERSMLAHLDARIASRRNGHG